METPHQKWWIFSCAVAVVCIILYLLQHGKDTENSRGRRFVNQKIDKWLHQYGGNHPNDMNLWMRYVKMMAKMKNKSDCYVCSVMPKSSHQPTLYGKPMTYNDASCFLVLTNSGYNPRYHPEKYNITAPGFRCNEQCKKTRAAVCDKVTFPFPKDGYNTTGYATPVSIIIPPTTRHPRCLKRNHTMNLSPPGPFIGYTSNCVSIMDSIPLTFEFKVEGGWWLCGQLAYPSLPTNWTGQCAPIFISDHTVFIHLQRLKEHHSRQRRNIPIPTFAPHDAVWGTDVPPEFKHWTDGQKVQLALFPWTGVAKNMLRLETIDYRLKTFVNISLDINTGQNEELQAIRLMVLQNRLVLDMMTAEKGGVCVQIGSSCCSFIPGENETHLNDAMQALRNLKGAMAKDNTQQQWDFFSWLISGPWWHWLIKLLTPFIVILISFCLFTTCMIPCLKSLVNRLMTHTLVQYQMLHTEDPPEPDTQI